MADESTPSVDPGSGTTGSLNDIQTSDVTASESSDTAALTPEQRDAATFAKHGFNPDGSPLAPKEKVEEPKEVTPKPETKIATPTADESEAGDDDEDDDPDSDEITDERITATVEAALELNPDLVKNNPKIRELLAAEIRAEQQAELDKRIAAQTASQARDNLIRQGKEAVDGVTALLDKAQAELVKAKLGQDDVNWDILLKAGEDVEKHLRTFGSAAVVDTQRGYETAFTKGFLVAQKIGGPMTEEEQATIQGIVNSANRMEADDKQGDGRFDLAKQFFYEKSWEFLAERAKAAGKAEAVAEAKQKRDSRKTVLDADAVIAGAAKEAAKRVKLPPAAVESGPSSTIASPTIESYRAAKSAGNFDLADEIMRAMESQTPATTRR